MIELKKCIVGFVRTDLEDKLIYQIKLREFKKIAKAAGYECLEEVLQTNPKPDPSYLFGKGKIIEIKNLIEEAEADYFLVYNNLSSVQKIRLEDFLKVNVLDRYDIVLEIFEQNAGDRLSKLQIELARLERIIPYIKKRAATIHFRDRPGPRSLGEYAYHKTVAQLISRRKRIREKLEEYKRIKEIQLENRKKLGIPIVTLCGFYGAGKTTIFNSLTNLRKEVKGIPFTTLSSKFYGIKFKDKRFMIADTIGFAFDIDPLIIKSFELTLEDIKSSDLSLLVIDASDDDITFIEKIKSNLEILGELKIENKRILPVLNKIDLIDKVDLINKINIAEDFFENDPIYISAINKYNLEILLEKILNLIQL